MENITNLDKLLMNINLVASFKNLGSKTELNGNKCKMLDDYIKDLETIIKVLYNNGNLDTELNGKQQDLLDKVLNNKFGK